jgi:hypothetical protein
LRFKIEFARGKSLRNKFPETSAKLNIPNRFVLFLTAVTMATGKEMIFEHNWSTFLQFLRRKMCFKCLVSET